MKRNDFSKILFVFSMLALSACAKPQDNNSSGSSPAVQAEGVAALKQIKCYDSQDQVTLIETTYSDGTVQDTCEGLPLPSSLPLTHATNVECGSGEPEHTSQVSNLTVNFQVNGQPSSYTFNGQNPECVPQDVSLSN